MKQTYPIVRLPEAGTVLYPYRSYSQTETGHPEAILIEELNSILTDDIKCLSNICINISDRQPPICPDLALTVRSCPDIKIDVEIDEPYVAESRKPIHYLSCGDMYRDHLLNRYGWTVVRLAIQQIQNEPKMCAKWLLELVRNMMEHGANTNCYSFASVLTPIEQWTRTEALKMAYWQNVEGESRTIDERCYCLEEQEKKSLPLVKPFDRTADMQQKMSTFRDAGCYEQDAYIDFEPDENIYIYKGIKRMLPVSSLIAYFFDEFKALPQAENQFRRYGTPVEESLDKWAKSGKIASEVGTFVHLQTENYFQRGFFETECHLQFGDKSETVSVEQEKLHFLRFIRDYQIEPYRQEWPVYDKDLNIAGTIDLICQEDDGQYTIYDWKRSSKVTNAQGQPIVEGFRGKMSYNGISLPDTSYYHYCIQQNLYRYMLEQHYGIKVKAMNLVVLCPDYPTYYVAPVPKMDRLISDIVDICMQRDLGHKLL